MSYSNLRKLAMFLSLVLVGIGLINQIVFLNYAAAAANYAMAIWILVFSAPEATGK